MQDLNKLHKKIVEAISKYEDLAKSTDTAKIKYIIAQRLRLYRAKHRLTQEQLATKLQVNRLQIIRWEQGCFKPQMWAMRLLEKHGIIEKGLFE
ncbi:MAG: helix-turn-helix domain-containing protein [Candidatus Omnitrophica bacterium]|nr:helix-turn-helix domain-containing protein [Candidatus Omnitrophota bacterium]